MIALTDSNGNVVATYSYDVWGNVTSKTGNIDNLYGYAGQYGYVYDQETGLYFLQSRYYNPKIGRFTTKDRFTGFEDMPASQNHYTYCENNPVMNVDPYGMFSFKILGKSLKNLYNRYSFVSRALTGTGISMAMIGKMIAGTAMYYVFTPLAIALG